MPLEQSGGHAHAESTGRYRDSIYYSILDDEWPEVKARLETLMARPGSEHR